MKKNITLATVLLLLFIGSSSAQKYFPDYSHFQKVNAERFTKVYLLSLQSENEGVVTSTLAHIGRIKLFFPEQEFPELEKKICELSSDSQSPNIRYRAFLICSVFNSPSIFESESRTEFEDSEALFSTLANTLRDTMFGTNYIR
ncbi:MAG: hypothetical protein HY960_05905 [Ignavibacteriae bacterium]|nr:hypothetical protein [Ignavibacteriota bacterium]